MEPKERQTLDDPNKHKSPPPTESPPINSQETREDTNVLTIHRPWADRILRLDDIVQQEGWWKTEDRQGDILELWSIQSMASEPYHNMKSVIGQTQDDQINIASSQSSQAEVAPSQTGATAGSE
ncbi:hypothetical protein F4821DRAFT_261537 [Hypoxylon rubiginosum]|uniref:Uncharacterized protein n=1 Tax=Hypoxylon rubiginosum TaxID=110542 RepID=A0ACC0CWJ6_9PEZI|nr:hypothetical protein F4821DRAFT_261537 [Hypoxylon rubiginosum]